MLNASSPLLRATRVEIGNDTIYSSQAGFFPDGYSSPVSLGSLARLDAIWLEAEPIEFSVEYELVEYVEAEQAFESGLGIRYASHPNAAQVWYGQSIRSLFPGGLVGDWMDIPLSGDEARAYPGPNVQSLQSFEHQSIG